MTDEQLKKILTLLGLLAITGCGSGGTQAALPTSGRGALAITISSAKSFNPRAEHGRIERYSVIIEGEGISEPIVAEFSGDATEGVVEGVPTGEGREISVEAINPNGAVILAGEAVGVGVGEDVTEVGIGLEAVPIFTNISNGANIDNTRLVFRLFSDPARPLVVEEVVENSASVLADASTNLSEIELNEATGLGSLSPPLIAPGTRTFKVSDLITGRESEVTVRLLDGARRKPAPLLSGAFVSAGSAASFGPPLNF